MTQLGDYLAQAQPGFSCGKHDEAGLFQFRMHNITREGGLDLSKRRRVPADAHARIERFQVRPGDVLFNTTNSPDNVGKSAYIQALDEPAVFSNHFLRLRPDPNRLDANYLHHWLQWNYVRRVFAGMCRQWVNQATVDRANLASLPFAPPSLEEQQRIAMILDKTEDIRIKRRRQQSLLGGLARAIFDHMAARSSSTMPLGEVAKFVRGVTFKPDDRVPPGPSSVAVMRTKNVQTELDRSDEIHIPTDLVKRREQYLQQGDILVSSANSWNLVGKACFVEDVTAPAVIGGFIAALRGGGQLDVTYLYHWFTSARVQAVVRSFSSQTTSIANLNLKRCAALEVPVPSPDAQREFATHIAALRAQGVVVRRGLAVNDQLLASVRARAFEGAL